ncbi:hypothetical protein MTO96_015953 [Rhipicephalus appendiculatus]
MLGPAKDVFSTSSAVVSLWGTLHPLSSRTALPSSRSGLVGPCGTQRGRKTNRLRPLTYLDSDVTLTCFRIDSPDILKNNSESERPDLPHFFTSVSIILAGKNHLRSDLLPLGDPAMAKQRTALPEEGRTMSVKINADDSPGRSDTCHLITSSDGEVAKASVPTVFENYVATKEVGVDVALLDSAGQEDNGRLRPLSPMYKDVTLGCFSIDSPDSLSNSFGEAGDAPLLRQHVRHPCKDEPPPPLARSRFQIQP